MRLVSKSVIGFFNFNQRKRTSLHSTSLLPLKIRVCDFLE